MSKAVRHAGAGSDDRFVDELNLSVHLLHLSQIYNNQVVDGNKHFGASSSLLVLYIVSVLVPIF